MNHLHWMKLYIGDELSNTAHMTPAEFGSYIFLKMHYWRFGCLPVDHERLARIAKVSADEWAAILPSIGPLFEDDWRDTKLEDQREEAEAKHRARVEAGRKGGRARTGDKQSLSYASSKTKAQPKQPEPEPEPEPDPYSDLDAEPEREPASRALDKRGEEDRKSIFTPFAVPPSAASARKFLNAKGVPPAQLDDCVQRMMAGDFAQFDLEGILEVARSAA